MLVATTAQLRTAVQTLLDRCEPSLTETEKKSFSLVLTADFAPISVVRSISQHARREELGGFRVHELLAGGGLHFPPPVVKPRTKEYIARIEGLKAAAETRKYADLVKDLTADQRAETERQYFGGAALRGFSSIGMGWSALAGGLAAWFTLTKIFRLP
eukprot:EC721743.1.p1 GENE.EC721743.1~~EC721743.1.p1  ORF type:complete len:158 (+),score=9.66 EC721743.1:32-505(+)